MQLSHLILGICGCVVQKTLVQLDAVIAVIDLFLFFERGAVFCTDGDLELTEDGKHAFFRCALLVIVVELSVVQRRNILPEVIVVIGAVYGAKEAF